MAGQISKNYSSSYLYGKTGYEKKIFEFIVGGDEIDKNGEEFSDILNDFKRRQVTTGLVSILRSPDVVLKASGTPLAKAFKVIYARDPRDRKMKVFIDITDIISFKNGMYVCKSVDVLIAYVISAGMMIRYFEDPRKFYINNQIVSSATASFCDLFIYILDYLRINGLSTHKKQIMYLIASYFQYNHLGRDLNETTKATALRISGLTEREATIVDMRVELQDFTNISAFIECIAKILVAKDLTLELFVDKWCNLFGTGTYYAPELLISFSSMLTDAYVGCYINNQKTIEKIAGKNYVNYTSALLKIIGSGDL